MTEDGGRRTDLWREDVWMGLKIWRCGLCPWDTVDGLDVMWDHLVGRHGEEAQEYLGDWGQKTEDGEEEQSAEDESAVISEEGLGVVQEIDLEEFIFEEVGDGKDEFDAEDGAG